MKPLWLEEVAVDSEPPEVVRAACTDGEARWALSGLLDRMVIDLSLPDDHAAVDPATAPGFVWWWHQYFRGEPARPDDFVWPHPPRELCHDPETVLRSLVWLREALQQPGVLKQEQIWASWLRFAEPYDPGTFARPFHATVEQWIAFCEESRARGHLVAFRMNA